MFDDKLILKKKWVKTEADFKLLVNMYQYISMGWSDYHYQKKTSGNLVSAIQAFFSLLGTDLHDWLKMMNVYA